MKADVDEVGLCGERRKKCKENCLSICNVCSFAFLHRHEVKIMQAVGDLPGSETQFFLWKRLVHQRPKYILLNYFFKLHRFTFFPSMMPWSVSLIFTSSHQSYFLKGFEAIDLLATLKQLFLYYEQYLLLNRRPYKDRDLTVFCSLPHY